MQVAAGATRELIVQIEPLPLPAGWREQWQSGDVHVHMFGTATLSFADGVRTEPGDVFEARIGGLGSVRAVFGPREGAGA